MEYYGKLRELREDNDLNQEEIARILHTNQKKISRIETGIQKITIDELKTLCEYYQISADYILGLPAGLPYPQRKRIR